MKVNLPLARRGAVLLLVVLLFTALVACKQQTPVTPDDTTPPETEQPDVSEPENPQPDNSQTEDPETVPEPQVGSSTYDKTFTTADGTQILTLSYAVPKIDNAVGAESLCMINAYYENHLQSLVDAGKGELLDMAQTAAQEGVMIVPYSDEENFTEEYQSAGLISFLRTRNSYTGGAHPNLELSSDTFDYTTGLRLTADDLFTVPAETYVSRIMGLILKQIEATGADNYFDDYKEILPQIFDPNRFYLTDEGMVFYFQTYDIAPYASGAPGFLIPYSELEDILTQWN
jgi:hypothetical protein